MRAVAAQAEGAISSEDVIGAGDGGNGEERTELEDDDTEDGSDDDENVGVDESATRADVKTAAFAADEREHAGGEGYGPAEDV